MAISMMENGRTTKFVERGILFARTEMFTMANGEMIKSMGSENPSQYKEITMKDTGSTISGKAMDSIDGATKTNMREIGKII